MNTITYRFTLDLQGTGVQKVLKGIKVGDTNRRIEVRLTNGGEPYAIAAGTSARIRAKIGSATVDQSCSIVNNAVVCTLSDDFFQATGEFIADIELGAEGGQVFATPEIMFLVYPSVSGEGDVPEESFNSLIDALAGLNALTLDNINIIESGEENKGHLLFSFADRATIDAGKASPVFKGAYDGATEYSILDIVSYLGSSYIYINSTSASGHAPTDITYWAILAQKGDKGNTGNTGATGVGVSNAYVREDEIDTGDLMIELTNGTVIDAGYVLGADGADGADGIGIASITKAGTLELVDTYTIEYTDGTTSTFTVTNGARGDTGATGPQGPSGEDGTGVDQIYIDQFGHMWVVWDTESQQEDIGRVSIVFRGAYSSENEYELYDVVTYSGSSYIYFNSTPDSGHAPTDTAYWAVLAAKGDTGATGETGATGAPGLIQGVKVNGTELTPDANSKVNVDLSINGQWKKLRFGDYSWTVKMDGSKRIFYITNFPASIANVIVGTDASSQARTTICRKYTYKAYSSIANGNFVIGTYLASSASLHVMDTSTDYTPSAPSTSEERASCAAQFKAANADVILYYLE